MSCNLSTPIKQDMFYIPGRVCGKLRKSRVGVIAAVVVVEEDSVTDVDVEGVVSVVVLVKDSNPESPSKIPRPGGISKVNSALVHSDSSAA